MMLPLDVNLASRPFRNNTLVWLGHALAAGLLLGATAWNATTHAKHKRDLANLKSNVASIESRKADLDRRDMLARQGINGHDLKDLSMQADKANEVIRRKALSWTRLFNAMEEVLPYDVKMISIRPVFRRGRRGASRDRLPEGAIPVSVHGAARSLEALLEFEGALLEDPRFGDVDPHRWSQQGQESLFDLRFLYFPESREEQVPEETLPAPEAVGADEIAREPSVDVIEPESGETPGEDTETTSEEGDQPPPAGPEVTDDEVEETPGDTGEVGS